MTSASSSQEPVAVVDWGFAGATFGVVVNGRPVFVRCLRGCGLNLVAQSLCEALGVSLDEAQRLLARHGLPGSSQNEQTRDELQVVTGDVATQPLGAMVHELNRTLSFLKNQRSALLPGRIWLFGGGATVKNIAGFLETGIGVPVDVWRSENTGIQEQTSTDYPLGVLAPAIAASSLAWLKT
jgi:Tfp pilus assembly PilM family ATPase